MAFLKARPFAIAAAGALALAALAFAPNALLRLEADHLTTTSQVESIALDDGSTIRLAPKSAVDVAFADDARSVRLLRGQAFFDVARDEERPFRVVAGRVETTVLGTAFDVRLHGDGAEVSVRRGAVRVATLDAIVSEDLEGGDWVRVSWDGEATRGSSPPGEVAAWVDGQFVAKEAAVSEVVEALRPYFDGVILIRGDGLADRRVTGIYRLSDPEAALRAVAEAQDAHVSRLSPWMLVISGS